MQTFLRAAMVLFLVVGSCNIRSTSAQDVLTAAVIIAGAQSLLTQLQNLGASVGGDVMTATNNAGTQISAATDHLNSVLHNQLNVPITELSGNLRDQALLLNSMVSQVNELIDRQRSCLFAQADIFVGGINTALATLKNGVPFVSASGATVTSFQFDNHMTPDIVPRDGGAVVVKGFKLWTDEVPPRVTITNVDKTTIFAEPQPSRAADDNSYRIVLAAAVLSPHAGSCLYINTIPRQRRRVLGIPVPGSSLDLATLTIPMCVPQETTMKVRLTAKITYDIPQPDQGPLNPFQSFRFDNSDCGHQHSVSMTKGWALPEGYTILSVDSHQNLLQNNNNTIQFSFNNNAITAAGTQDSPTCVSVHIPPFGPNIDRLLHPAIWDYSARPVISGTKFVPQSASADSSLVDVVIPATQLCASIAKLANATGRKTSISYIITPVINGNQSPAFSSPVFTTDDATDSYGLPSTIAFNGEFTLSGMYNPTPVEGNCQACVTLTALNTCGF